MVDGALCCSNGRCRELLCHKGSNAFCGNFSPCDGGALCSYRGMVGKGRQRGERAGDFHAAHSLAVFSNDGVQFCSGVFLRERLCLYCCHHDSVLGADCGAGANHLQLLLLPEGGK